MDLARVDLNLLVAFHALAETRSVSVAAERLGIRQPAMSATLARLRALFGDRLFVRSHGAMQPTPLAQRLMMPIAAVLDQLRVTLDDAVAFDPAHASQRFRIASTDYTTMVLLPRVMARIEALSPGSSVEIIGYDKRDIEAMVARGDIDLAIGTFASPPPDAVQQRLLAERFVGVARAGHPAIRDGRISLDDFVKARHVLTSVRGDRRGAIDRALADAGLHRTIALVVPHMLALPPVIAGTDLIGALPSRMADRATAWGLQCFDLPVGVPAWHIEMLWNPMARSDAATAWLRAQFMWAANAL